MGIEHLRGRETSVRCKMTEMEPNEAIKSREARNMHELFVWFADLIHD